MAKIIALDIGGKRTGIAETDFMQIIASPLETVETDALLQHLLGMFKMEKFEAIVVGDPKGLDGGDSDNSERVRKMILEIQKLFPEQTIHLIDERFTSKLAQKALVKGGMKKKQRREKGQIDKISAAIILESFLAQQSKF